MFICVKVDSMYMPTKSSPPSYLFFSLMDPLEMLVAGIFRVNCFQLDYYKQTKSRKKCLVSVGRFGPPKRKHDTHLAMTECVPL